jgi:transcriptional regulator with XRE-family HTH domain
MGLKDVFIKNLKKYRKEKKVSQMALAELCGTST